jgi:hypothetical protein
MEATVTLTTSHQGFNSKSHISIQIIKTNYSTSTSILVLSSHCLVLYHFICIDLHLLNAQKLGLYTNFLPAKTWTFQFSGPQFPVI